MTMSKARLYQKEIKSVSNGRDLNNNNNNNNNNPKPPYRVNALSKISKKPIPHYLKPTATSSSYVSKSLQPKTQKQTLDSKSTLKTSLRSPLLHSDIQKQTSNCTSTAKTSSRASLHSRTQKQTPNGTLSTKTSSQNSFLHSKNQKQTFDNSLNMTSKNHMQKANSWSTVRNSYHTVTKFTEIQKKTCPTSTAVRTKSHKQTVNGYSRSRTTPVSKANPVCFLPQRPSSADSTKVRTRSIPSISSLLSPIKAQSIIRSNSKIYRSSTRMTMTPSTPMILTVIHEEDEEEEDFGDASEKADESKGGKVLEERVKYGRAVVDEEAEMHEIEYPMSFSGPFDIRSHKIEQVTNKFSIGRQNKVKALAGAFETAISSQKSESRGNNYFIEQ